MKPSKESLVLLSIVLLSYFPPISSAPLFPKEALPTRSGYLPVSNTSSSSSALFFAFYEAQHPASTLPRTPLLIWLQGGPGCSSMVGNFFELGPWLVSDRVTLEPNPYSWNRLFGLLFIDNPIGVGFSVAASPDEIPRDQPTVARHLWFAVQSFLFSEPSFRSRPLYITGESYAGKYVPSFGYHVLRQNRLLPRSDLINLRGVAIGNGLTHPVVQVTTHAASAYFSGLINERQRAHLERLQENAVRLTLQERWPEATDARNEALSWLQNVTGLATLYDLRRTRPYGNGTVNVFLREEEAKEALRAAKEVVWRACDGAVEARLHGDVMKSAKFMVEGLVRRVKVLLYQGLFDLRDGVVSTEAWVREMQWEGVERFLAAERKVWEVSGGEVGGYVQRWGRLSHVVVSGAGHMVPADQGLSSQAMIEGWVQGEGLFREE